MIHADDGDTQSDFVGDHPRLACRSELVGLELTSIDVVRVDFNEALPLLGQVIFFKDRRYGTDWHAGATVNALRGVDVELLDIIETWAAVIIALALFRMNTIHRASVYTGRVFDTDARFGDNICHFLTSVLRLNTVLSKERVHQDKEPIDLAEGSGGTEHSSLILSFFSTDRWPRKPSSEEHVHGIAYLGVSGR